MDQVKYEQAFVSKGFHVPSLGKYLDRFGIGILNEITVTHFLNCIESLRLSTEDLRALFKAEVIEQPKGSDEYFKFIPALLVDFDKRSLTSMYPEPMPFETYIPNGWTSKYEDFLSTVPLGCRYWLIDGEDWFEVLGTEYEESKKESQQ